MSRIKDLFAIENGDDDLAPVDNRLDDYLMAAEKDMMDNISDIKDQLRNDVEFDVGVDENGHNEFYVIDFYSKCHSNAMDYVDKYIEEQHIDLSGKEYIELCAWSGNWLADILADYETELCLDYANDNKYKMEELKQKYN